MLIINGNPQVRYQTKVINICGAWSFDSNKTKIVYSAYIVWKIVSLHIYFFNILINVLDFQSRC